MTCLSSASLSSREWTPSRIWKRNTTKLSATAPSIKKLSSKVNQLKTGRQVHTILHKKYKVLLHFLLETRLALRNQSCLPWRGTVPPFGPRCSAWQRWQIACWWVNPHILEPSRPFLHWARSSLAKGTFCGAKIDRGKMLWEKLDYPVLTWFLSVVKPFTTLGFTVFSFDCPQTHSLVNSYDYGIIWTVHHWQFCTCTSKMVRGRNHHSIDSSTQKASFWPEG